jgi:two-component system, cell cycle sensor histidine kinase and response regulator CckA
MTPSDPVPTSPPDAGPPPRLAERRSGKDRRALEMERAARKAAEASLVREMALSRASAILMSGTADPFPEILAAVGEATGVSRTYLFRIESSARSGERLRNTHEWCARGVSPQIHRLQELEAGDFLWWTERLRSGEPAAVEDVGKLGEEARAEREILESQGIQATLAMPLLSREGDLLGFMGFDDVERPRAWSGEDRRALRTICEMVTRELERREAEETLRKSEERYRLATRATRDVVYDWDLPTGTLLLSPAVHSVLAHSAPPLPSREWWDQRIHPEDRDPVLGRRERALAEESAWEGEYRFRRGDGGYARVLDRGYVVRNPEGAPIRMVGVVSDLTERYTMEERLRHSQKMEAVGRLAGGVAHDFNNILAVILGSTEFLLDDTPPGDPRHADLVELGAAARHGASLTGQLLALSRKQVLEERPLDLEAVVEAMERLLQRVLGENIALSWQRGGVPLTVMADRSQLEQVLLNLAINARDAMPSGGRLRITTRHERILHPVVTGSGLLDPGPHAVLEVADSGEGMDPGTLPRIFEPFFTTKPDGRGTGLGLATVYGIVQQSGGHIQVESEPEEGTTFIVHFPLLDHSEPPSPPPEEVPERAHPEAPSGKNLLVVEDEPAVATLLRRGLEGAGYSVQVAHHPTEAVRLMAEMERPVHLVITDVMLPGMGGPELAAILRREHPSLQVLFISGHPGPFASGTDIPPSAFLRKPFGVDQLLGKVAKLFTAGVPAT